MICLIIAIRRVIPICVEVLFSRWVGRPTFTATAAMLHFDSILYTLLNLASIGKDSSNIAFIQQPTQHHRLRQRRGFAQPALQPLIEAWQSGKPIRWQRVHDLPDFAYFDHSVHVNNGVGCVSCHGRVDEMPLTWRHASLNMQWCLDCHRDPAQALRPRDKVFDLAWQPANQRATGEALIAAYHVPMERLTECSTCHR